MDTKFKKKKMYIYIYIVFPMLPLYCYLFSAYIYLFIVYADLPHFPLTSVSHRPVDAASEGVRFAVQLNVIFSSNLRSARRPICIQHHVR
jgi:hypothetical protein